MPKKQAQPHQRRSVADFNPEMMAASGMGGTVRQWNSLSMIPRPAPTRRDCRKAETGHCHAMSKITDPQIATLIQESKRFREDLKTGSAAQRKKKALDYLVAAGVVTKTGRLTAAYR